MAALIIVSNLYKYMFLRGVNANIACHDANKENLIKKKQQQSALNYMMRIVIFSTANSGLVILVINKSNSFV